MKRIATICIICGLTQLAFSQGFGIGTNSPSQDLHVVGNSLVTGSTYIGSTDSRFYRDQANRIRTPDQFYVDDNSAATYLYSSNTYLGASSGDNIHLRDNTFDWTGGDGGIINSSGNVGIGTTSPSQKLQVNGQIAINNNSTRIFEGSGNAVRIQTSYGWVDVGSRNTSWSHFYTDRDRYYFNKQVYFNGNVRPYSNNNRYCGSSSLYWYGIYAYRLYYVGAYTFSDRRLKTNIHKLTGSLSRIMALKPVSFHYIQDLKDIKEGKRTEIADIDGKSKNLGFIAQDVKEVFPALVKYNKDSEAYVLNIDGFISVLVDGMQEQQKMLEDGQKNREALKEGVEEIKALINK